MDVEISVTKSFHDDAPFWELAAIPGVKTAECENVPGCGHYFSLQGSRDAVEAVSKALTERWPDVAAAINDELHGHPLDLSVGIEFGIFNTGDTGNDIES